jgi:hypothetical protein
MLEKERPRLHSGSRQTGDGQLARAGRSFSGGLTRPGLGLILAREETTAPFLSTHCPCCRRRMQPAWVSGFLYLGCCGEINWSLPDLLSAPQGRDASQRIHDPLGPQGESRLRQDLANPTPTSGPYPYRGCFWGPRPSALKPRHPASQGNTTSTKGGAFRAHS